MKTRFIGLLLLAYLILVMPLFAQDTVIIPNVIGLNVPQAAAELNRAGLRLGSQSVMGWDAASSLSPNTISFQSIAAGSSIEAGATIDVTVLRSPNIALVYDDNDLTVINLTTATLNINGLAFTAVEGATASFAASRWAGTLNPSECSQIWSVSRNGPKDVAGCESTHWLTTNNSQEHFWTAVNGVVRFRIMDNGVERAGCDAAPSGSQDQPLRCEAYIAGSNESSEVTSYVYFAYTMQAFAVINRSPDKWMLTEQTTILNHNPGISIPNATVLVGDPTFFGNPSIVADITRLAPGQCLFLTSDNINAAQPEPCDMIARLDLTSSVAFWLANFQIDSAADDEQHQCPAAVSNATTICVMPR
jgi:hypothetical protein